MMTNKDEIMLQESMKSSCSVSNEDNKRKNITKLPSDFNCERYGIKCRMATIEDSAFIVSLRTNQKLSKYLHHTDNDVEKQKVWMRKYLERNARGEDYYFVYTYNDIPFSVNRIYNITDHSATGGSWLCIPGTLPEVSIASLLLMRDILFEFLVKDYDLFDVQDGNKQVRKLHIMMGAKRVGMTDDQENFSLFKEDYFRKRESFMELLHLNR